MYEEAKAFSELIIKFNLSVTEVKILSLLIGRRIKQSEAKKVLGMKGAQIYNYLKQLRAKGIVSKEMIDDIIYINCDKFTREYDLLLSIKKTSIESKPESDLLVGSGENIPQ
jgi:hypothetical protein